MKREDDEQLWDLLGKSSPPALSPFFARNVLREVRALESWSDRLKRWFSARRFIPATAVAVAILAAALTFQKPAAPSRSAESVPDNIAQLDAVDYEVVADLDDLLALEEDNLWDDGDISTL